MAYEYPSDYDNNEKQIVPLMSVRLQPPPPLRLNVRPLHTSSFARPSGSLQTPVTIITFVKSWAMTTCYVRMIDICIPFPSPLNDPRPF